jgi:hypothetical protein
VSVPAAGISLNAVPGASYAFGIATARARDAPLITCDAHFDGLPA